MRRAPLPRRRLAMMGHGSACAGRGMAVAAERERIDEIFG